MDKTTKMRWLAVVTGLISTDTLLIVLPKPAEFFSLGTVLLLGGVGLASSVALVGMLYEFRRGAWGPLVAGTLGFSTLLYLLSKHHVSPSWPIVGSFLGVMLVTALARMAFERVFKRVHHER